MTKSYEELKASLQAQSSKLEQKLAEVNAQLKASTDKSEAELEARVKNVKEELAQEKKKAETTRQEISDWFEQKNQEVEGQIQEWKHQREVKKLTHRAERAQRHAENTLAAAAYAVLEAEDAVLDAILATAAAEEVAAQG